MNYYGTREATKLCEDRRALSQLTLEMLTIGLCITMISCTLALICFLAIPRLKAYGWVFIICAMVIPLQGLGKEWFYQAIDEYRYISVELADILKHPQFKEISEAGHEVYLEFPEELASLLSTFYKTIL